MLKKALFAGCLAVFGMAVAAPAFANEPKMEKKCEKDGKECKEGKDCSAKNCKKEAPKAP